MGTVPEVFVLNEEVLYILGRTLLQSLVGSSQYSSTAVRVA